MTKKDKAEKIVLMLEEIYPDARCSLIYNEPYELMIAGRLSAQCTDARVNIVTKILFDRYKTLEDFANADESEVAEIITPCGLYKTKAKSICEMTKKLYFEHDGVIPTTIEELTTFSGIGRKTANLIMGDIHKLPAIVTDTHCIRITNRFGLSTTKDPKKTENELLKVIPAEKSSEFCHRIVIFGREFCTARNPKCDSCPLKMKFEENGLVLNCKL